MGKLKGSKILLAIWDTDAYKTVVCLTQQGLNRTAAVIDTSSKCDEDYGSSLSGRKSITMPLSGISEFAPAAGALGYSDLEDLWNSGEAFDFKIFHADGDVTFPPKYGTGVLLELNDTYNDGEAVQFTGSINVNGAITAVDPHTP